MAGNLKKGINNPANRIKAMAKRKGKSYWQVVLGAVHNQVHTELQELESYQKKCEERRNSRNG